MEEELTHTKEFCDYFIHNREQLTKQLSYWMDKVDKLEKKLEIGLWALRVYSNVNPPMYSSEEDEESSYTSKLYDYRIAREALEKIGEIK